MMYILDEAGEGDKWLSTLLAWQVQELEKLSLTSCFKDESGNITDVAGDWIEDNGGQREWSKLIVLR